MSDQLERMSAIAAERQAREAVLDTSHDLTTDELDRYDAAVEHRKSLGLSDRDVGEWDMQRDQGYER